MLTSDHFLHAVDDLFCHIALCFFSAVIVHGHCPQQPNFSTLIPIPKGSNANLADSNNYRGIALSSILCKMPRSQKCLIAAPRRRSIP